ncbi:MAG: M23 family metallopeptidase [Candidatus Taylorbacteria bacterium]
MPQEGKNQVKYSLFSRMFLIGIILFSSALLPNNAKAGIVSFISDLMVVEQSQETAEVYDNTQTMNLLQGDSNPNRDAKGGGDINVVDGDALQGEMGPLGTLSHIEELNREISVYTVRSGDTLSEIAEMFEVSTNTILWSNDIPGGLLKEGQTLVILPISGINHVVKSGDTVKSITLQYKADKSEILAYNDLKEDASLKVGQIIMIPDAEVAFVSPPKSAFKTQITSNYYLRPTKGVKTQGLHGYNGIDIGAPLGTPIVASATGVVIVSKSNGWNGGYGSYVVIKHGNGTQTLYAHMSKVTVSSGATVSQGQKIGEVGHSGNVVGPTGNHLHFEVRGAKNPF